MRRNFMLDIQGSIGQAIHPLQSTKTLVLPNNSPDERYPMRISGRGLLKTEVHPKHANHGNQ